MFTFIAEAIKIAVFFFFLEHKHTLPLHQLSHRLHVPALRRHVQTRVPVRRGADEHAGVHGDEEAHDVAVAALSRRQQHHLVVVAVCSLTRARQPPSARRVEYRSRKPLS